MNERMNEFETNTHTNDWREEKNENTTQQINNTIIVPPAQHTQLN